MQGSVVVRIACCCLLGTAQALPAAGASVPVAVTQAVADAARPAEEVRLDALRKPAEVIAFAGLRSGDIDLMVGALRSPAETPDLEQIPLFEDELSIVVREELVDLRLAGCVFGSSLIVGDRNPLSDREIGEPRSHGGIAGDDAVKNCGVALRKNHSFAATRGTA